MSGLAPTLIIVRVAYGKSVESVQQMMSIHFAERTSHQATGPTAGISRGTAEIRARSENDHGDGVLEEVKLVVKGDESRMI
ncbi:hypothetical protein PQX77_016179 [Marasmius sp. AFHP31]|nr:hypothetical protein PQX77_016179 [Marasmius sp. AFHP31]